MTLTNIVIKAKPPRVQGSYPVVTETNKLQLYPITVTLTAPPPNAASETLIVFNPIVAQT